MSSRTTLGITTAQEGLESGTDGSGALFTARAGIAGIPSPRWRGSTATPYRQKEES